MDIKRVSVDNTRVSVAVTPSSTLVSSVQITCFQSSKVQSLWAEAKSSRAAHVAAVNPGLTDGLTLLYASLRRTLITVCRDTPVFSPAALAVISRAYESCVMRSRSLPISN